MTKQYTPMSSRGRDLYPSLHTRHTSPPVRSSSSSSEMSSMPSMLLGDIAEASKSRAPDPSGEPVGGGEAARGVIEASGMSPRASRWAKPTVSVGFPNDGDAGDRRVRPISRSIFSRRSIALRVIAAFGRAAKLGDCFGGGGVHLLDVLQRVLRERSHAAFRHRLEGVQQTEAACGAEELRSEPFSWSYIQSPGVAWDASKG